MEISFEICTKKGDTIVVSLSSSYDFIKDIIKDNCNIDIEVIDVSIIRKVGNNPIPLCVLGEISRKISDILDFSPNAILFYYCESFENIPLSRNSRNIYCQEYRDRLFSLMFNRYSENSTDEWNDYKIETTINQEPQYLHLIYRTKHKDTIEVIGSEVLKIFRELEPQK